MVRVNLVDWIFAVIAVLTAGLALAAAAPRGTYPVRIGLKADRLDISASGTIDPKNFDLRPSAGSRIVNDSGVRVASLETGSAFEAAIEARETSPDAPAVLSHGASFGERFFFEERAASFDERFATAGGSPTRASPAAETKERTNNVAPPPRPAEPEKVRPAIVRSAPKLAMAAAAPPAETPSKKRLRDPETPKDPAAADIGSRTAIYDIAARTVYLPNGDRLEAHSGLGRHLDDPRFVNVKNAGPTPPNVYDLKLREELFHGVRAIRLIPVDDGKMFGRDGMLAHSYMLGPNGQSNGCVSFNDYRAFLTAFLKGDVDRMVVVERLARAPNPKGDPGSFAQIIGKLFKPFESTVRQGQADDRDTALSYQ